MKKLLALTAVFTLALSAFCQEQIAYRGDRNYILVERTDLRRYDNGKYVGLTSREIRSFISPQKSASLEQGEFLYEGNFYVSIDTKHKAQNIEPGFHQAIPSTFTMDEEGNLTMIQDNGYPSFRSFPAYTHKIIYPGQSWTASAERAVDPLNTGKFTKMPLFAEYTYLRDDQYHGEDIFVISARWATRYGAANIDPNGDKELSSASGSHNATIYVSKLTGKAVLVRDTVDETFAYTDGRRINFKGTILLFTEYPPVVNQEEILPQIREITGVDYTKTGMGLMLSIQDLRFMPDSDQLLPGEEARLDQIARVLKQAPGSTFLIEGHTARAGSTDNDMELSLARATSIARELVARGVPESSFICKGSGSSKPVADNSTEEGRKKNRRVEITILE